MKPPIRNIALLPCLAAFVALTGTAFAASISGTAWSGWSTNVPTFSGLPTASSAAVTFTTDGPDFCVGDPHCSTPGTYNLLGFLNSNPNTVSNITFHNGAAGSDNLDNTLWEFTGTAFFTTGDVFPVAHDDGTIMYVGGTAASDIVINAPGPTSYVIQTYTYTGPTGLQPFTFIYGETGGPPAVYQTIVHLPPAVPEPSSILLLGTGLFAAVGVIRRRLSI